MQLEPMSALQPRTALVTGVAGFIGFHATNALLDRGIQVIGVDSITDYYPIQLKHARLAKLNARKGFVFHRVDIAHHDALKAVPGVADVDVVLHLAAQAGVRYSIENPFAYGHSNLIGHLSVLELVRHGKKVPRLVYASSSSVYGANTKVPFVETDPTNDPVSLYAATKRSCELLSESYSRLYGMRQVGLRFFTVYGPWGRPDMAYWSFTRDIIEGRPIKVFNDGQLQRDFTSIDDIIAGVMSVTLDESAEGDTRAHRIYNIGNNRPVKLGRFIEIIEAAVGRKADKIMLPMQQGDVVATYANVDALASDHGFTPTTPLEVGIPKFVEWYLDYTGASQ